MVMDTDDSEQQISDVSNSRSQSIENINDNGIKCDTDQTECEDAIKSSVDKCTRNSSRDS
jgi:hypothetical protein